MFKLHVSIAAAALGASAAAYATAAPAPAPRAAAPAAAAKPAPTRAALLKGLDTNFKAVDTNGDGVLTQPELAAAESRSLQQRLGTVRSRMDAEFTKLDTNRDSQLSKAEFMAAAPQAPAAPTGANILAQLDKNKDGKISGDEYRSRLLVPFDRADTNHDGTLSATERQAAQASAKR